MKMSFFPRSPKIKTFSLYVDHYKKYCSCFPLRFLPVSFSSGSDAILANDTLLFQWWCKLGKMVKSETVMSCTG